MTPAPISVAEFLALLHNTSYLGYSQTTSTSGAQMSNVFFRHLANTVRSRSLREHTFKKLIKITILVREGIWGLIYEFEGTSGGPCRELNFEFESPLVNAATAVCYG